MITSKHNATIKEIRSLADKKFRDVLGLYTIEGVKLIKDAISLNMPITSIVGTEKGLAMLGETKFQTLVVSEEIYKYLSEQVSPQGALAVVKKTKSFSDNLDGNAVFLDGVADPANVGAIIRTAAASGYKTLYMTIDSADPYSPKAVRSAMGGLFRVNIVRESLENLLENIDKPLVVADMNGQNAFKTNIKEDFCLVIGNEGRGVSEIIRTKAKYIVSVPMENGMESLNAAVSAGILMYSLKK